MKKHSIIRLEDKKIIAQKLLDKFDNFIGKDVPFNIIFAKLGFPVYTMEGYSVRLIDISENSKKLYPIVGYYKKGNTEILGIWTKDGYNIAKIKTPLDIKMCNITNGHKQILVDYINKLDSLIHKGN